MIFLSMNAHLCGIRYINIGACDYSISIVTGEPLKKEEISARTGGAAVWRPAVIPQGFCSSVCEEVFAEALLLRSNVYGNC